MLFYQIKPKPGMCPIYRYNMYNHVVNMFLATFPDLTHQHSIKQQLSNCRQVQFLYRTMCSFITLSVTFLRSFNFFVLIRLLPVKLKGTLSLSLSKPFCYGLVIDLKLALQLYSESRNYKSSSSLFRAVLTIA